MLMLDQKPFWTPPKNENTAIFRFMKRINETFGTNIENYSTLHRWSCDNISSFWGEVYDFCEIKHSRNYDYVFDETKGISDIPPVWFPGARLNFAENVLRRTDDKDALIFAGEVLDSPATIRVTFKELHELVRKFAASLRAIGVNKNDRVSALMPNCIECTVAMLATASIGAIWSSASTDFGTLGVLERFSQVKPKVIFSVDCVMYKGKLHMNSHNLTHIVKELPSIEKVVIIPFVPASPFHSSYTLSTIPNCISYEQFLLHGKLGNGTYPDLKFEQLPFNHPLFIMFSSGTTGAPKCIVHSAGGTLIKHLAEHVLQTCMTSDDVILFYTTVGWMMWNWLISALSTGATVALYDGSPFVPKPTILFDLVDQLGITILGMGAKCISVYEQQFSLQPSQTHKLSSLHSILTTGSPLNSANFEYIYRAIKPNLLIGSISGGTDIIACFMGASWACPVYKGECQCLYLGCDMQSWTENGKPIENQRGELVCLKPFPSMPTHFLNDTFAHFKYKSAYFNKFPGVWAHGDYCIINKHTGGVVMLGRSDATLNPNGVRFGSSEIYNVLSLFPEIEDSVCVSQTITPGEERVVLFVKMGENKEFTSELEIRIRSEIRNQLSARHVPAVILPVDDIPYTVSGKKVEIAVKQVINGEIVKNKNALANPNSLDLYMNLEKLKLDP